MIRVVLVDDDAMVRTGLRLILSAAPDLEVVGEAADGADGAALVRRVSAPTSSCSTCGCPASTGWLPPGTCWPTRRTVAGHHADHVRPRRVRVRRAGTAGASGFLLKDVPPERLVAAVRQVREGDVLLAPEITRRLVARYAPRPLPAAPTGWRR